MADILSFFNGGGGIAAVTGIFLVIQALMSQKSAERLASKKLTEEKLDELIRKVDLVSDAGLVVLHDRIKYLARTHIKTGSVTYDERQDLMELKVAYFVNNKIQGSIRWTTPFTRIDASRWRAEDISRFSEPEAKSSHSEAA